MGVHKEMIKEIAKRNQLNITDLLRVPNKGRDIGPLMSELGHCLDTEYDIYGHIHTKKSVLIGETDAAKWRRFLIDNLLGTRKYQMADKIITDMIKNDNIGIVFPDDPTCIGWSKNRETALKICRQMGINEIPENFNFPIGTMFCTKECISPAIQTKIRWEDYPEELIDMMQQYCMPLSRIPL